MQEEHVTITPYADELTAVPRAHLALKLSQDDDGLKLLHDGKLLVECNLTRQGMVAASYLAKVLGATVPPLGETATARVSTGVLFRAVSIASLDYDNDASYVLLERWLAEAEQQRGGTSEAV